MRLDEGKTANADEMNGNQNRVRYPKYDKILVDFVQ
jgi:hypothetical protein